MRIITPLLALTACAIIAASCNKKCTCKIWYDGYVPVYYEDVSLDRSLYSQCSDMDSIVSANPKEGRECIND